MLGKLLSKFIKPKSPTAQKTQRIDMDNLNPEERGELFDVVAEASALDFFEGIAEHGYTLESVGDSRRCPRCKATTENQYGHYVYATQSGPRIMMAPAGHFCTACPTVVIDEDVIRAGVKRKYRFKGIVGMSHDGEDFYGFETWNGSKPIFIFDENHNILGVASKGDPELQGTVKVKPSRARGKLPRKVQNTQKDQRKKSRKRK